VEWTVKSNEMKNIFIPLFLIVSMTVSAQRDNNLILPHSKQLLDKEIHFSLEQNQEIFQWDEQADEFIWSVLVNSDSMVSIGYRPVSEEKIRARIHTLDLEDQKWKEVRENVMDTIWTYIQSHYANRYSYAYLFPDGINSKLPVINVKIFDLELVKLLRGLPQVRYFHPMEYTMEGTTNTEKRLSDSGCGSLNGNIVNGDYSTISPQSRVSWHHQAANIDLAWNSSNKGEDVWVAVIDTGVSDDQDKLNGDFDEGESSNRIIEKRGFYKENETDINYDGWQDQCGHGTQMAGLIAAPRGFDNTPAGIAYKANLVSYRATRDVVINRSTEKMGVSKALTDAADDARIKVISMSLGDVFYNGQVADAIVYAHNKGKLIFAAAGTSTYFTSFVGVIFPASMDETVAVTGVQSQDNINDRKKCDTCHKGSSVDFVSVMQRSSDKDRDAITLDRPNNSQGYVGGSSAATATTAGIAALVWGNNPNWASGQVLNKLIQSADYYPNRDGAFGWCKIDAQDAVNNTLVAGCTTTLSNEVTIEITNISFPAEDDNGNENEWVITLEGESYYFDVDEDGASGNPANYINLSVCGKIPILVELGGSNCNENSLNLAVSSHEDDSSFSNCTLNSFDDHHSSETIVVSLVGHTFTHTSSAGDFIFTYIVYCSPTVTPASSIVGDTLICQGNPSAGITFTAVGGMAPYTIEYSINNAPSKAVQTNGNTATVFQTTNNVGMYDYQLIKVTDTNGCSQEQMGAALVEVTDYCHIEISIRSYLEGIYEQNLMKDTYRALDLIPSQDPYGNNYTITNPQIVLADQGNDSIVDWVEIIVRQPTDPPSIISKHSGLLQKDGDIVDVDGISPISISNLTTGSYYIGIKHRNHLEVMTLELLQLINLPKEN